MASLIESRQRIIFNAPHVASTSGSVATFKTTLSAPLKNMIAYVNPVQEEGEKSPSTPRAISGWTGCDLWKGGKNLLDLSILRQGSFIDNYWPTNVSFDEYLPIKGGATYVWSTALSSVGARYVRFYDVDKQEISTVSLYGATAQTFTAPANAVYYRAMWYRGTDITPSDITADQIELGSTATAYEPYNGEIKSISWHAGKNMINLLDTSKIWSEQYVTRSFDSDGVLTATTSQVNGRIGYWFDNLRVGQTYTFSVKIKLVSIVQGLILLDNKQDWTVNAEYYIEYFRNETDDYVTVTKTFTATSTGLMVGFYLEVGGGTTTWEIKEMQLELGSTATEYEPYNNVVYGGYVDILKGLLTTTSILKSFTWGSTTGTDLGTVTRKNFSIGSGFIKSSSAISDVAAYANGYSSDTTHFTFSNTGSTLHMFLPNGTSDDLVFNVLCIYETPITYQLSPVELKALLGNNTIFADTGDVAVDYWTH